MNESRGWRDDGERYGRVSRWLHWSIAGLLLTQFTTVLAWRWLGSTPLTQALAAVAPHGLVGLTVFVLMAVRLIWAWGMRAASARPMQSANAVGEAARVGHMILNALTLCIPGAAILRSWASGRGMEVWGVRFIPGAERQMPLLEMPADWLHSTLAWALLALALGHGAAALSHRLIARDGTLQRML
ncbi:cytochrome b [Salinicola halophilus]|uniref:cytochrome b n=1 Tax=Salinicola halophilus TaxID=184065 RepID=UPI0013A605CC|nr:cytochrome b/b6 domain-containing protein [Salinicola halophilus]